MDRKINAAAFKARCLALIDEVAEKRPAHHHHQARQGEGADRPPCARNPRRFGGRRRGPSRSLAISSGPIVDKGRVGRRSRMAKHHRAIR